MGRHWHSHRGAARSSLRAPIFLLAAIALSGCVFFPRTTPSYTGECLVVENRLTLDSVPLELNASGCSGDDCLLVLLAVYGGVTAGSAVVSGSVVLIGNTMYWLEKKGRCNMPAVARAVSEFLRDPLSWRGWSQAASSAPEVVPTAGE
jgi:hypothetical protein